MPERVVEARMCAALELIAQRRRAQTCGSAAVALSYADFAAALGLTESQVRCAVRRLAARGLVGVLPRHLPNGGQLENGFIITAAGDAFLLEKGFFASPSVLAPARGPRAVKPGAQIDPARRKGE